MNEWWSYFKEIPTSVKVRYFIVLPIGIFLDLICRAGEFAEKVSDAIGDWVRKR
jgi:hypothetical protein